MKPISAYLLLGLVSFVTIGCSKTPALFSVSGVVKRDGKPAADTRVRLHPADGEGDWVAEGRTDSQGAFLLKYRNGQPGAPVGEYKVTLSTERTDVEGAETFPPEYSSPDQTTLTLNVPEGGTTTVTFEASTTRTKPRTNVPRDNGP